MEIPKPNGIKSDKGSMQRRLLKFLFCVSLRKKKKSCNEKLTLMRLE